MLRQKLLPAILVVLPATTALMAQSTLVEATVDECRIRPGSATPPGTHWYYRVKRANNQHCWYLSSADTVVRGRGAIANAHRHLARRSARVLLKQSPQYDRKLRPQTASVRMVPARTALAAAALPEPPVRERATPTDFAARWPDFQNSRDFDAREVVTKSYADTDLAADADQQMPLSWPIADANPAEQQQASVSEPTSASAFLGGALVTALLLAGGIFYLAGYLRRTHSPDRWRVAADPPGQRWPMLAGFGKPARPRLPAGAPRNASAFRARATTGPTEDIKTILRDLQRAGAAGYSPRSFAPAARTRRIGSAPKQTKSLLDVAS
jgi:hypothetical protein